MTFLKLYIVFCNKQEETSSMECNLIAGMLSYTEKCYRNVNFNVCTVLFVLSSKTGEPNLKLCTFIYKAMHTFMFKT